jgi:hypothetical protein
VLAALARLLPRPLRMGRLGQRTRLQVVTGMLAIANGPLVDGSEQRPIVGS